MAKGLNKVMLIGFLGQDPDSRYSSSGNQVVNMTLAVDMSYGQDKRTEWVRLVAFKKQAETLAQYAKKGSHLYVEGRMETRKYQNKQGGDCYSTSVVVEEFKFLGRSEHQTGTAQAPQQPAGGDDFDDDVPF